MKICPICKIKKDDSEYYRQKAGFLAAYCKPCNKKAAADWRAKNPERCRMLSLRGSTKYNGNMRSIRASHAELLAAAKQATKAVAELIETPFEKHWHYDAQAALKAAIEKAEALNKC